MLNDLNLARELRALAALPGISPSREVSECLRAIGAALNPSAGELRALAALPGTTLPKEMSELIRMMAKIPPLTIYPNR
jgi:hypothetical protein